MPEKEGTVTKVGPEIEEWGAYRVEIGTHVNTILFAVLVADSTQWGRSGVRV